MKRTKLSRNKIAEVFAKKGGNISATCSALGIDRCTFYKWKKADEKLAGMLDAIDESLIDNAESKLLQKINEGDTTCLIFFLKTKGKNRGYVERIENNVTVNPFEELMKRVTDERRKTNKEDA